MKSIIKKFDSFRSSIVFKSDRSEPEVLERLKPEQFDVKKTGRHGFPNRPTCLDYDPLQNILAIGTANGGLRILGKPGIESHVTHNTDSSVIQLLFLINEGGLVSACEDGSLHLWSLRQTQPAIIHSLKFHRERITYCHLPFQTKWLFVGTERGNVHLVNIETFALSGYTINWNKFIEMSCKKAPGPVVYISDSPIDPTKLLVCHESGNIILWDLRAKKVDTRFSCTNSIRSASWLSTGRQFVCSHCDGSLTLWNVKSSTPCETIVPHGRSFKNGKHEVCSGIDKVLWLSSKSGDLMLFSGGMAYGNPSKGVTFQQGKLKKLLTAEEVVDFTCICPSPYVSEIQDPQHVIILLTNELLVFDISSSSHTMFPMIDVPYSFTIHESPVTCTQYYVSCPHDLLPALFNTGIKYQRPHSSSSSQPEDCEWPITGGSFGHVASDSGSSDLVITGHADGSVKFWDASSCSFQFLTMVTTHKFFDKVKTDEDDEDHLAIQQVIICIHSRTLVVSNASNFVMIFNFSDKEQTLELTQINVNMRPESANTGDDSHSPTEVNGEIPEEGTPPPKPSFTPPVKWKSGLSKTFHAGFQPHLCCQCEGAPDQEDRGTTPVSSLSISSSYFLLAIGNQQCLALVDYLQKSLVTVLHVPEIYLKCNSGKLGSSVTSTPSPTILEADPPEVWRNEIKPEDERERKRRKLRRSASELGSNGHPRPSRVMHRPLSTQFSGSSGEGLEMSDGSSRSSSICGLEGILEIVQTTTFSFTFGRRTDSLLVPSIFVGTSLGSVYVFTITLPSSDQRETQPVTIFPSGLQFNHKGPVLSMAILNNEGHLFPAPFEFWKSGKCQRQSKGDSPSSSPVMNAPELLSRHFAVMCTEKQAKVYSLPSQHNPYKVDLGDDISFVLKADIILVEGSSCLVCLNSSAHLQVYSLPSLQTLLDVQCFLPMTNYRFIRTFVFAYEGQAIYMSSPSEVERLSCLAKAEEAWCEAQSSLFTIIQTPEKPSKGFFSSLFSSTPSTLDREKLFDVESGQASRGIAQLTPGTGKLESLQASGSGIGQQMSQNKEMLFERHEKLSELEERTSELRIRAEGFSSAAYALMQKEKNRKWYQL